MIQTANIELICVFGNTNVIFRKQGFFPYACPYFFSDNLQLKEMANYE